MSNNLENYSPHGGRVIKNDNTQVNIGDMLEGLYRTISISGVATNGTPSIVNDTTKDLEPGLFANKLIKITIDGVDYIRTIIDNLKDEIMFSPLQDAVAASAVVGVPEGAQITIVCNFVGDEGNSYLVEIVNGEGENIPLSAVLDPDTNTLIVTLATDAAGLPNNASNTGMAVAAAIDVLPEFIATMTGAGGVVTETLEPISFIGGIDGIVITEGTPYEILLTDPNQIDVKVEGMGNVDTVAVTDPDALTANELGLLRGILKQLKGNDLVEQLTEADAVDNVLTFSDVIHAVEIVHEEATWQTFIVNGISITRPQGSWSCGVGGTPSAEVTIPAGITCAVGRLV